MHHGPDSTWTESYKQLETIATRRVNYQQPVAIVAARRSELSMSCESFFGRRGNFSCRGTVHNKPCATIGPELRQANTVAGPPVTWPLETGQPPKTHPRVRRMQGLRLPYTVETLPPLRPCHFAASTESARCGFEPRQHASMTPITWEARQ